MGALSRLPLLLQAAAALNVSVVDDTNIETLRREMAKLVGDPDSPDDVAASAF